MFIKFEGDSDPKRTQWMYHCDNYLLSLSVHRDGPAYEVQIDHGNSMVLCDMPGMWHRAYVMNDKGDTVETIYAPKRLTAHENPPPPEDIDGLMKKGL